jgi:hypothetical protein
MSSPDEKWQRLVRAARQAPAAATPVAPHGFATRVVAQAGVRGRPAETVFERLAVRAFGVACLLALCGVIFNFMQTEAPVPAEDVFFMTDDPGLTLLDLT